MAAKNAPQPDKTCAYCLKPMVWSKALRRGWEDLKYCSTACQRLANREKRRAEPSEPFEDTEDTPPSLNTQRFNKPRRMRAMPKG